MKNEAIKDAMNSIENRIRHVYNQGYENGLTCKEYIQIDDSTAYERGLNDAWECARKMVLSDEDGGIALSDILKIFGMTQYSAIKRFSASEAIAKLKEYEEKQKPVEDAEIKVGDEVIYCGGGAHDGSVGVVLGTEKDWVEVRFKSSWNCVGVYKDALTKTNRHFSQIEEVLEQMKGEEEC